jgi:hypothetical protein
MTIHLREHLDVRSVLGNPRRADEHRSQRPALQAAHLEIGLERAQLTPECVALRADVHQTEMLAIEHDQPGARSQHGRPAVHQLAQRLAQSLALDAERHRRGLAPRDHEPVEVVEVDGRAHFAHARAQPAQHPFVRLKPALQGEDSDQRHAGEGKRRFMGAGGSGRRLYFSIWCAIVSTRINYRAPPAYF